MPIDLLAYAAVAAILFVMLFRVLGTRQETDQPTRPNPFVETPADIAKRQEVRVAATEVSPSPFPGPAANASSDVQQALFQMALIDKNFDAGQFVSNAKEAYRIVVESFAKGDRDTLRDLLAPPVYRSFEDALSTRERAGESLDIEIRSIGKADIVAASVDQDQNARITVRFSSEQVRLTRGRDGALIDGDDAHPDEMIDDWTFARRLRTADPRWLVVETEDGDDSDGPL